MVFKNYMKIFLKNIKSILFSFILFMVMLVLFTGSKSNQTEFKDIKLKIVINDKDKSSFSKDFVDYLKNNHYVTEKKLKDTDAKKNIIEEKMHAYIEIKKDFKKNLLQNKKVISILAPVKTSYITFLKIDLKNYLNYTLSSINSNTDKKEVLETLNKKIDVNIIDKDLYNEKKENEEFNSVFLILSYIIFMLVVSVIININSEFKKDSILKRMALAPYNNFSKTIEEFFAQVLISTLISVFYIIISILKIGKLPSTINVIYTSFAVLIFSFTAIAFGNLLISISKNSKDINGINSAFSLILAFSSGVFIPIQFLPKWLVTFSKFMPLYYFVKFLEKINFEKFLLFILSQIIFIVIYTTLSIFIKKYKLKTIN